MSFIRSRIGADLVLLIHFAFIVFAGTDRTLFYLRRWAWLRIPSVLWSSIVNLANWTMIDNPLNESIRNHRA